MIPTIEIEASSPSQQQYTIRSKSFEIPRERPHAHFASVSKPEVNHGAQDQRQQRPSVYSRRSFTQSVSSFSLYSHFAGERFSPNRSRAGSKDIRRYEKGDDSSDAATNFSNESGINNKKDDADLDTPKASVSKAMFMFLKAFIGSGVLFLPKAFHNGGIVLSPILMVIVAVVNQIALLRLVETQVIVGGSYGDVGGVLYGSFTRYVVLFFLVISQMGFVSSYFIFISGNLVIIVDVLSHCVSQLAQKYYIWISCIVIAPLVLIRYIAKLSIAAVIADIFIVFGLISCIYFTSRELHDFGLGPEVKPINSAFALMIGTATFAFEGIGLVLPIGEAMKKPERFPFVITMGMIIVCAIYILIGGISYLAYGNRIQAAVVYNFPRDNPLTVTVHILYTAAIILSAPLVLFPATKILENALFKKCPSGSGDLRVKWVKNLFRIFLLGVCALVAFCIGGDNLDIFVSLVGSIACVPLCFIFPGLFHYKIATSMKDKIYDILLCIFGVVVTGYTFYVTVDSLVHPQVESFTLPPYCPKHT